MSVLYRVMQLAMLSSSLSLLMAQFLLYAASFLNLTAFDADVKYKPRLTLFIFQNSEPKTYCQL